MPVSLFNWFCLALCRRDAEDLLRDKALGCFLIRLSDKAVGYILSYKWDKFNLLNIVSSWSFWFVSPPMCFLQRGLDRCRHFVITQGKDGLFAISGDCQTYRTLKELIEHYKVSPIQPFGEYLTSSCNEVRRGLLVIERLRVTLYLIV